MLVVPLPCTTLALLAAAAAELAADDATAAELDADPAALLELEELLAAVPFWAMAAALKAACDFSAVGLMLKTMPFPQWPFWRQYIQMGCVVFTWNIIIGGGLMLLPGFGMKPESTPLGSFSQGVLKEDCVTVWFSDMKVNCTMSPTSAVMLSGV